MTTHRDEELIDGHPLHGWLADMLRTPLVTDLPLKRMSYDETEQQIASITGTTPSRGLLDDVMVKSRGNSYLTELLVQGVSPDAALLPRGLPDALRAALLAAWHRLSETTRHVVQMLAVGGRPLLFTDLARVLRANGVDDRAAANALSEAIKAGVVQTDSSGEFWFRHPLLAEVLCDILMPGEEKPLHALFAEALSQEASAAEALSGEALSAGSGRRDKLLADLALHCERADLFDEAFGHYLAAAKQAERMHGFPEQMHALLRAAKLWDVVSSEARSAAGVESEAILWSDLASVAKTAGDADQAFAAIDRARTLIEPRAAPLVASRVCLLWGQMATFAGRMVEDPVESFEEAVSFAREFPDSVEYTQALAALAGAEAWAGDQQSAVRTAEAAVAAAGRCGGGSSPTALSTRKRSPPLPGLRRGRGTSSRRSAPPRRPSQLPTGAVTCRPAAWPFRHGRSPTSTSRRVSGTQRRPTSWPCSRATGDTSPSRASPGPTTSRSTARSARPPSSIRTACAREPAGRQASRFCTLPTGPTT